LPFDPITRHGQGQQLSQFFCHGLSSTVPGLEFTPLHQPPWPRTAPALTPLAMDNSQQRTTALELKISEIEVRCSPNLRGL